MMNRYLLLIIVFVLLGLRSEAQHNFKLIGEGTEKQVKLLWLPEKWYQGMDGVVIKRRDVSKSSIKSDWITLSHTTIRPGNWKDKDLSNISESSTLISELQMERTQFMANNKSGTTQLREIKEDYIKNELNSTESTKSLILMFTFDYDLALLMGFGYIDTQYPRNYSVEYGIFPVINGSIATNAAKTFEYKVGTSSDLSFIVKKSKIKKTKNIIHLKWVIDTKDFKKKENLVGFNIYKKTGNSDYIKLNSSAIWINKSGDEGSLVFSDTLRDLNSACTYGIAAASIFKNESKKYETAFSPQNYSEDITPPVLQCNDNIQTDYVSDGVSLQWTFKAEQEPSIKGFLVERKLKTTDNFIAITDTLSPSNRKFHDSKVPQSKDEHYIYRVNIIRDEALPVSSNQLILFYNPRIKIERPTNLTAEPKIVNNQMFIHLKWNGNAATLNYIKGYTVLCDRAWGKLAREVEISPIKGFEYDYKVEGASGTKYLFAIAPVDNDEIVGKGSDTISIMIPTIQLPFLKIWPINTKGKKVTFDWKYPNNIKDLKGFRIYQNGILIANETSIKADQRSWTSSDLEKGNYSFQIEAVTNYNVVSEKSDVRYATVK